MDKKALVVSVLMIGLSIALLMGCEIAELWYSRAEQEMRAREQYLIEMPPPLPPPVQLTEPPPLRDCLGIDAVRDFIAGKDQELYRRSVLAIHWQESKYGKDPDWRITGEDGEEGEFRVTPIWITDVKRLFGVEVDPFDKPTVSLCVELWLRYYAPLYGAATVEDMCGMHELGPTGFREWKRRN